MTTVPLGRLVEINPLVPEFDDVPYEESITFMPLDACWPDGRADTSRRAAKSAVSNGYTRFRNGDVLLPKITPTFEAGRVFVAELATPVAAGTTELHILRARPGVDSRFVAYVGRSRPFLQEGERRLQGVGNLRRVPPDFIAKFPVQVWSETEQRAIADYLDRETAQIDTLIAKQERLIAALQERRGVGIDSTLGHRVGRGQRLKWFVQERDERAGAVANQMTLMSVSIVSGVQPRSESTDDLPRAAELTDYKICAPGDLVVNRMRAFQGAWGVAATHGIVSPDYAVLATGPQVEAQWLSRTMRTSKFLSEIIGALKGIGSTASGNVRTPRINVNDLGNIRIDVPSLREQQTELAHLDEQTSKIDALIAKAEQFIALAKERRAALITAAVTGQIDVTTG